MRAYVKYILAAIVAMIAVFTAGCSQQPSKELSFKAVERTTPSRWYDNSYLEYFDAYGPVRTIINSEQKLVFRADGRLESQLSQNSGGDFEIRYNYHDDGRLDRITSYHNGAPYRLSEYQYDDNKDLQQVRYLDYDSGQQFHSKHKTQPLKSGWFAVDLPVEQVELPLYKQFDGQGRLVWSSKSEFNHGVGRHFNLSVGDSVISSRVINAYTLQMHGIGGYGYEYDSQGRLWKVTSYNDDNHDVYHTTRYFYNEQGLIKAEAKLLLGKSLFNDSLNPEQAQSQTVNYHYQSTDQYGNWTYRTVTVTNGGKQNRFEQMRRIEYYVNNHSPAATNPVQ
ncbi:hypothetical protein [Kaarinaea lacus]